MQTCVVKRVMQEAENSNMPTTFC